MVAMTDTVLPDDRPLTIDDLDLLPDDGNRYELDDGLLVVSPSPALKHQLVLHRISVTLDKWCPPGFAVLPGLGVEISRIQYRVPDLIVVPFSDVDFDDKTATKPPLLAIEVASPSTAIYDRNRKKDVYEGFGIASYWIIQPDLDKPSIITFELDRGEYRVAAEVSGNDTFRAVKPFACEIVPAELVAGPWSA
jgi:Uma2 family endonuclease